ncbi:hypothetical protein N8J89_37025 [Crossiella sp. CA-258035]|uniref:hypothetical protein n=1 Tax=Crossiella sp. CA-258035 TaxID=2981138 RepID=UPI0024BC9E24|nr:hypothetical protein [Crossiella sp. CA-258035]WHT18651.1 hypothetical protein N8J89_37025 [Crossiella sp. CA-258035]
MRIEIELDSAELAAGLVIRIGQERTERQASVQVSGEDQDAGAAPGLAAAEGIEAVDAGPAPQPAD